jgi:hypothetical protein
VEGGGGGVVPGSQLKVALGVPRVPVPPAPTPRLMAAPALTSRRRAAPGEPRVLVAPAPTSGLGGGSGGTMCPRGAGALHSARGSSRGGSSAHLPAQGSARGATCPRGSSAHLPAQGSARGATWPRDSGAHLPLQGSSGGTMCPRSYSFHLPPDVGNR